MARDTSTAGLRAIRAAAALMIAVVVVETPVYGTEPLQQAMQHPLWLPATAAVLAALGLTLWGLPALVAAQGPALGRWGRRGVAAALVGVFLNSGLIYTHTFVTPMLAADFAPAYEALSGDGLPPIGLLVAFLVGRFGMYIGLTVFGVATLRAGVVPTVAAALVVIGGVLGVLVLPAGLSIAVAGVVNVIPFVGLAMMASALRPGVSVSTEESVTVSRPSPVS